MEAKLELLEEVQNEAEGEEAGEEGPWVRSFIPFLFFFCPGHEEGSALYGAVMALLNPLSLFLVTKVVKVSN